MKAIWLIGVLLAVGIQSRAQFFNNFFDQHATQLKNLAQQVAELEILLKDAEKGYKVVEGGLQTIQSLKNGEFNLHNAFYSSLESINPAVKGMAEVAEIISIQISIVEQCSKSLKNYRQSAWLHPDEVTYIGQVYQVMLQAGIQDLNELISLTTADQLKMGDAQRIARIQALDTDMQRQQSIVRSFNNETDLLCLQREKEEGDVNAIRSFYGLP
ncbi:MAG TPA: hypothetical protein VMH27_11600 [Puia sp.]|nr:hypothetical protein [Puia sp.]